MAFELDGIVKAENLKAEETRAFMSQAFAQGYVNEDGTAVTKVF